MNGELTKIEDIVPSATYLDFRSTRTDRACHIRKSSSIFPPDPTGLLRRRYQSATHRRRRLRCRIREK